MNIQPVHPKQVAWGRESNAPQRRSQKSRLPTEGTTGRPSTTCREQVQGSSGVAAHVVQ